MQATLKDGLSGCQFQGIYCAFVVFNTNLNSSRTSIVIPLLLVTVMPSIYHVMGDHQVNSLLISVCVLCYKLSCNNFLHLTAVLKCATTKIFLQCLKNYSRLATTFTYTSTITVSLGF